MSGKRSIFEEVQEGVDTRPTVQPGAIDAGRKGARGAIRVWLIMLFALAGDRKAISFEVSSVISSSKASMALSALRTASARSTSRSTKACAASVIAASTSPPIFMIWVWIDSSSRS